MVTGRPIRRAPKSSDSILLVIVQPRAATSRMLAQPLSEVVAPSLRRFLEADDFVPPAKVNDLLLGGLCKCSILCCQLPSLFVEAAVRRVFFEADIERHD